MDMNDKNRRRAERNLLAQQIFKDACGQALSPGALPDADDVKDIANEAFDCANIFMMVQDSRGQE